MDVDGISIIYSEFSCGLWAAVEIFWVNLKKGLNPALRTKLCFRYSGKWKWILFAIFFTFVPRYWGNYLKHLSLLDLSIDGWPKTKSRQGINFRPRVAWHNFRKKTEAKFSTVVQGERVNKMPNAFVIGYINSQKFSLWRRFEVALIT